MKMRIVVEDGLGNIIADDVRVMRAKHQPAIRRIHTRWMNTYKQLYYHTWARISISPLEPYNHKEEPCST